MNAKISCVVLGAGGHSRVLIDCLQYYPDVTIAGILCPETHLYGETLHGIRVLGNDDLLGELFQNGISHFVVGLGSVGDNLPRKRLFEAALMHGFSPLTVKHPSAVISASATHGNGCQFLPGSIVNIDASLSTNVIINSSATVEHDCVIADHVHIATGAILTGGVHVGQGAHIGAGATIRQNIFIGEFAVIGAGAVVVKDVPSNTTVVGVPAKTYPGKTQK